MNKVCVKGQRIYFYRRPEPIPKSQVNFSRIEFDMDETWGSFLSVVAQFIQNGEPKNVQVKDGYCFVPPELEVGAFELCLRGDDGESVVASVNRLIFEVCEGFDPSGETPLPPSPDLYTQLIKEIDSGKKIAQSVREDADAGLFNGKRGADGGWYTPSVIQTDENTLRMGFTPSKGDMPDVAHTDITLPSRGGGTSDHSKLSNRDATDQHPMSAITGLEKALEDKQPVGKYLTTETDPTVPSWAKEPTKPGYTAFEVGADPSGTAASQVSAHNTETTAHSDIRLLIQGLTERLNALADSDDTTLDQLSEVVLYIKSNRTLIEAVTTSKVSVADIIDNLTTNAANKPLSAAQGVALKALIDAITIPTALPNPNALTFTGAVSGSYDGSAPLEVEIPSGGGGGNPLYVKGGTTLAEGTIPSGLARYTFTDTGLKLYEVLQEWKIFFIQVYCAGEVNNINIYTYRNNSQPFYNPGKDCNYALSIFEGVTKDSVKFMFFSAGVGNYWDEYSPTGIISSHNSNPVPTLSIKHIPPDTGLYLRNYGKDTGHDYLWKVTGLVKWG